MQCFNLYDRVITYDFPFPFDGIKNFFSTIFPAHHTHTSCLERDSPCLSRMPLFDVGVMHVPAVSCINHNHSIKLNHNDIFVTLLYPLLLNPFWLVGFVTSSSTTRLYRGRVPRLTSDNFTCFHLRDRTGRP